MNKRIKQLTVSAAILASSFSALAATEHSSLKPNSATPLSDAASVYAVSKSNFIRESGGCELLIMNTQKEGLISEDTRQLTIQTHRAFQRHGIKTDELIDETAVATMTWSHAMNYRFKSLDNKWYCALITKPGSQDKFQALNSDLLAVDYYKEAFARINLQSSSIQFASLTPDKFKAFTIYHELGHAGQTQFVVERTSKNFDVDRLLFHNAHETFSDCYATLRMAQVGSSETAAEIAKLRLLYATVQGPAMYKAAMTKNKETDFAGAEYDTSAGIRSTLAFIHDVNEKMWDQVQSKLEKTLPITADAKGHHYNSQEDVSAIMRQLKKSGIKGLDEYQLRRISSALSYEASPTESQMTALQKFIAAGEDFSNRGDLTKEQKDYVRGLVESANQISNPGTASQFANTGSTTKPVTSNAGNRSRIVFKQGF